VTQYTSEQAAQFYAETYDTTISDWPGEMDFYLTLAGQTCAQGASVLELACGTGRVAIRLAEAGFSVVGLDHSSPMLKIAQEKSEGMLNVRWVLGDMRSFQIDESFGLIIIPGHAFQNLNTAAQQVTCLQSVRRHLQNDGTLVIHVDHQEVGWLGEIATKKKGVFEPGREFIHPTRNSRIRTSHAWAYEPASQTAVVETVWEELDGSGQVAQRIESGPIRLHCAFRFEMEYLFTLLGYDIQAVYGDFHRRPLVDESSDMIWIVTHNISSEKRILNDAS